jgi:hypothetical protein
MITQLDTINYNDEYFINKFKSYKRISNDLIKRNCDENEINYLINRYNDSFSLYETLIRIIKKIDIHPKCKICNKPLPFYGNREIPFRTYCSIHCANSDPDVYNKQNETKLIKYKSKNNYKKIEKTCLEKYNTPNVLCSNTIFRENSLKTKELRYGNKNYVNYEKIEKTCLEKYGVKNVLCKGELRSTFDYSNAKYKEYKTKKLKGTINTSLPEKETFIKIKEKFRDAIYQYKSKEYPFMCDIYIPSLNLYIECNYHWTHGDHLFNENNKDDISILNSWKIKNSEYYKNAITTWTIRDINKYNIAKKNNLNYLIFYSLEEFNKWYENL